MSYTDPIPLRMSTEWPEYPAVYALSQVYGRVTMKPQPYDSTGALWLIAGHAIAGIDAVSVKGQTIDGYALQNGTDPLGKPVSVLELATPVESRDQIIITLRGKQHPDTGVLLDRPDLILYDWLVNVCGMAFDVADFDDLRSWSQSNSVVCGGVIDAIESIQSATDRMTQGMGLAWGPDISGVAVPWPPSAIQIGQTTLNIKNADSLKSVAASTDLVTVLSYRYATNWADGKPGRSMVLEASSVDQYGRREAELSAGWLQAATAAEDHASRWLAWNGAPVWRIEADTAASLDVGDHIGIDHPYCSMSGAVVVAKSGTPIKNTVVAVASELNAGEIRILSRSSGVELDVRSQADYVYADGKLTYTVTDETGSPIARASVTLDGTEMRLTDNQGRVQFVVGRGSHTLKIEAEGFIAQTVTVTL